jgi:hypothetical protein
MYFLLATNCNLESYIFATSFVWNLLLPWGGLSFSIDVSPRQSSLSQVMSRILLSQILSSSTLSAMSPHFTPQEEHTAVITPRTEFAFHPLLCIAFLQRWHSNSSPCKETVD